MQTAKINLTLIGCLLLCGQVSASPLSELAAGMQVGEWRELPTENINPTLLSDGASGVLFGFAEELKWDPVSRRLYYAGGDHTYEQPDREGPQFVFFDENSNRWDRLPRAPWMHAGNTSHGYDHQAIIPGKRAYYTFQFRSGGSAPFHKCDLTQASPDCWTELAPFKSTTGLEYFPDMDRLIVAGENTVRYYDESQNRWVSFNDENGQPVVAPMGGIHNHAEYNPIHKVMVFGGGQNKDNHSRELYKLDDGGKVTTLNTAPVDLGVMRTIFTVDLVSGEYLVFTNSRQFYTYDVVADRWSLQSAQVPIFMQYGENGIKNVVAAPISTYRINLFVKCERSDCKVFLYKHSPGGGTPQDPLAPLPPRGLIVQ